MQLRTEADWCKLDIKYFMLIQDCIIQGSTRKLTCDKEDLGPLKWARMGMAARIGT